MFLASASVLLGVIILGLPGRMAIGEEAKLVCNLLPGQQFEKPTAHGVPTTAILNYTP